MICVDCFFEKILAAFVYNLLDFGKLCLLSIDLVTSSILDQLHHANEKSNKYISILQKNEQLLGTIFKPYYHLELPQKVDMAKRFFDAGLNLIKEDETYIVPKPKLLLEAKTIQMSISGQGNYIPNVSHYIYDYRLIEKLLQNGIKIVMVDFLVAGFRGIYILKEKFPEILLWGHRVGYWSIEKFISMKALGTLAVLAGIDFLHIGTPINREDTQNKLELVSYLRTVKPQFVPVFTKTTPEILLEIMNLFDGKTAPMGCGYFRKDRGTINWENVMEWVAVACTIEKVD